MNLWVAPMNRAIGENMADYNEEAENTAPSTPPVEASNDEPTTQDESTQNDVTASEGEAKNESEESNDSQATESTDKGNQESSQRSPRAEKRISKLTAKLSDTIEENRKLREKVATETAADGKGAADLQNFQGDERIRRIEETLLVDKVGQELETAEMKYPQLNPDSSDYDPQLAQRVSSRIEREVFEKNNFNVKQEIDDIMDLVGVQSKKYAARVNGEVSEDSKRSGVPAGNAQKNDAGINSYDDIRKRYKVGTPEYKQAVNTYTRSLMNN